jgi:hypothetical protein
MGKVLLTTTTAILLPAAMVFAQMGSGQGGHMTGTERGWGMGWGMGYGWGFGIILLILVVFGAAYLRKKK